MLACGTKSLERDKENGILPGMPLCLLLATLAAPPTGRSLHLTLIKEKSCIWFSHVWARSCELGLTTSCRQSWQNRHSNTDQDEIQHLQQAFALSVASRTVWSFPKSHPCIWNLQVWSNNRLAKGMQQNVSAIRGVRKLAKQSSSEETAPVRKGASRLCYCSPVPPTVISPKLWGKEQRSLCQAQWQLSFLSGCRECHHKYQHLWQTRPLLEGRPLRERLMMVEILIRDGVILLLLAHCSKVLPHQRNDKVSAKLHRYKGVFPRAGENKVINVKILLCLSSRWTRILVPKRC